MDPATIKIALTAVNTIKKTVDTAQLKKTVDEVKGAVGKIDTSLADEVVTELRTGFDQLAASVLADEDETRRSELAQARTRFARLSNWEGSGSVEGSSIELTRDQVRALGHLGNYWYFLLTGEGRLALAQVYRCTRDFPALAIQYFPRKLYAKDHSALLTRRNQEREQLQRAHRTETVRYQQQLREFRREWAWKAAKAAGLALGGLAAAAFNPPMAVRGFTAAGAQLATTERPIDPGPRPSTTSIDVHDAGTQAILRDLAEEATRNLRTLEAGQQTRRPNR